MSILKIVAIAVIITIIIGIIIGIFLEIKDFNKGYCPLCGNKLRYFDTDSQGGRGYTCDNCNYHTWISYNFIDKNFLKEECK